MATLLIVEDELVLARNLSKAFVRHGFEVHHATGIAEGRRIASTTPVDVALLDLRLPDGSGLDLLRVLRPMRSNLHAIVLSGYGMEEDLRRSRALGFDEHFVKPINPNRLIAALDALRQRA